MTMSSAYQMTPFPESARDLEDAARYGTLRGAVQPQAEPVLGAVDACDPRVESRRFHAALPSGARPMSDAYSLVQAGVNPMTKM